MQSQPNSVVEGQPSSSAIQVLQKAHTQAPCPISFVGVDAPGEDGGVITRKQRQEALKALADDITEVVEWPCHWRITQQVAQVLMTKGREELDNSGAGCYSLANPDYVRKEEPHLLWATAAFWKGPLQGMHLPDNAQCSMLTLEVEALKPMRSGAQADALHVSLTLETCAVS